jgi:hypothetical protein
MLHETSWCQVCPRHNGTSSTVRLAIKNFMKLLSAQPDHLCIQLLPFLRYLSSLGLFMNTASSSPTIRTKNFEARRKEIKRLASKRHQTWRSWSGCSLFRKLIHLQTSFVAVFFDYRHKGISSSSGIIQIPIKARMMIVSPLSRRIFD